MISASHPLWHEGEYSYPLAFGFMPDLVRYLHDEDGAIRPAMIIVPGGAYHFVSPTEAEIVALTFFDKGYNTFVLTYTTDATCTVPLKGQPMRDLARALRLVRKNAGAWRIDPQRVAICGFSAGGHLCGSLAVHFRDVPEDNETYGGYTSRPDAVILCYPVITSGAKAHRRSFEALLGSDATAAELAYMSLEKQVTPATPPVFLWHTVTDELVAVENSYLFARACREYGVMHEHHVFASGTHGLSLANAEWAAGRYGSEYTLRQTRQIADKIRQGELDASLEYVLSFLTPEEGSPEWKAMVTRNEARADEAIAQWPVLADIWLNRLFRRT